MFSGAWKESSMEKIEIEIMDENINEECEYSKNPEKSGHPKNCCNYPKLE